METAAITAWTFQAEVPIPQDVGQLLVRDEQPWAAFRTFRDTAIFTSKRLIVKDSQGLTGRKVEMYSLPYSAINMWSSENAGTPRPQAPRSSCGREPSHQDQARQGSRRPPYRPAHRSRHPQ